MKHLTLTAVSFLLISLAGVSYSQVPQIEREALIALYNSADGENWGEAWNRNGPLGLNVAGGVSTNTVVTLTLP